MEFLQDITLGNIATIVTFTVALISGIVYLRTNVKKWIANSLTEQFKTLEDNQAEMARNIAAVDLNGCKDYLVRFLSDVESGQPIDEIEKERFYERYQHYIESGGNSYIKSKVEKLKHDGKL